MTGVAVPTPEEGRGGASSRSDNVKATMNLQQRIRIRAYEIWEREGRPEDHHLAHWQQAVREIAAEEAGGEDRIRLHEVVDSLDDPDANRSADGLPPESPLAGLGQPKLSSVT